MKQPFFAAMLIGAMAFSSCSSPIEMDVPSEKEISENTTGNTVFKFTTSAISVGSSRSAEDSYVNEQGTQSEWIINKARVYLFDATTKNLAKTFMLKNLKRTESGINGYVAYTSDHVLISQGNYDIFAVANTDAIIEAATEDAFLANIDQESYKIGKILDTSDGIIMSNRASANLNTTIISSEEKNLDNEVTLTLERVVARVDVATNSATYQMKDEEGKLYATVSLNSFHLVNLPKSYYTFRHTAVLTSMDEPTWDISTNFGNVEDVNGYVIDPYFFKKSIDATNFNNSDAYYVNFYLNYFKGDNIVWTDFKTGSTTPQYNTCYTLENCAIQAAQKNGYSTGVVFRGELSPANNVYKLNSSGNLELMGSTETPSTLYYYNYAFYNSVEALAKIGVDVQEKMDDDDLAFLDVKRFTLEGGKYYTYYTYWIKHLDNNDPLIMGVMEFGVVRNNLYRLLVTNISELGPGNAAVNPDQPDEGEAYLKVMLNVKPWIVRAQTNIVL